MRKKILAFAFAAALLVGTAVPLVGGGNSALAGGREFGEGTSWSARGDNPSLPNPGDLGQAISSTAPHGGRADAVQDWMANNCP